MKKIVQKIKLKSDKLDKKEDKAKIEDLYRTGLSYYRNNEYKNALIFFDIAAECEHKDAQYVLGIMYSHGKGVPINYETSLEWYHKAAANGSVNARRNIGVCYRDGIGTEKNYKKALLWMTQAAENGDVDSQYSTAVLYNNGFGDEVPQDYKMAYLWFKIAAENDHIPAQYALGLLYHEGHGIEQDYTKALTWFTRIADRDKTGGAYNNIGHMYEKGLGVTRDYKKAMGFYIKASYKGNGMANDNIGHLFEHGLGVAQDDIEAVDYYKKSADQGNKSGQLHLGIMLLEGRPEYNLEMAMHWLQKAHQAGHPDAKAYINKASKVKSSSQLLKEVVHRDREDSIIISKEDFEDLRRKYQIAQEKAEQAEKESKEKEEKMVVMLAQLEIQKSHMQNIINMAGDSDDSISLASSKNITSIKTGSSSMIFFDDIPYFEKLSTPNEFTKESNQLDYIDYQTYPSTTILHKPNEKDEF